MDHAGLTAGFRVLCGRVAILINDKTEGQVFVILRSDGNHIAALDFRRSAEGFLRKDQALLFRILLVLTAGSDIICLFPDFSIHRQSLDGRDIAVRAVKGELPLLTEHVFGNSDLLYLDHAGFRGFTYNRGSSSLFIQQKDQVIVALCGDNAGGPSL